MFKRKYFLFFLVVVLLIVVGFLRDFIFVNLNYQASLAYYHQDNDYKLSSLISFIETWSYKRLYISKWILTMLFTILYGAITYFCVYFFFREKKYNKISIGIYIVIISISFLIYLFGYFTNNYQKAYSVSRQLMGLLQSPIIIMLLLPALYLNNKK